MPVHQLILKSGSLDSSVISVFIRAASVILNSSITIKIFGLEYDEPDFPHPPRRASLYLSKVRRPLPQTWDSLPGILRETTWGEQLRSETNPKDYPVRAGKFYTNKVRKRKWAHHKSLTKLPFQKFLVVCCFSQIPENHIQIKNPNNRLTVGMLFCSRSKITNILGSFFSENSAKKFLHAFIAVCFNQGNTIVYWFIELLLIILYVSFNKYKQFPAKPFQD